MIEEYWVEPTVCCDRWILTDGSMPLHTCVWCHKQWRFEGEQESIWLD